MPGRASGQHDTTFWETGRPTAPRADAVLHGRLSWLVRGTYTPC
jgi:hypothetical protein